MKVMYHVMCVALPVSAAQANSIEQHVCRVADVSVGGTHGPNSIGANIPSLNSFLIKSSTRVRSDFNKILKGKKCEIHYPVFS